MIRIFLLSSFGACLLALFSVGQAAPIHLYDLSLNIDGDVSSIVTAYNPGDTVPAGVDASGFDYLGSSGNPASGLGSIMITTAGAGMHSILAYFDHELDEFDNGFFNEFGETGGVAAAGQSWEIDDPGSNFGNLINNFAANTLENMNDLPQANAGDVAMAMGWNFTLAADETAAITFTVGESPSGGFYLTHRDNLSDTQIFLSSTLNINGGIPVPEPDTLALLGLGLAGMVTARRKNKV